MHMLCCVFSFAEAISSGTRICFLSSALNCQLVLLCLTQQLPPPSLEVGGVSLVFAVCEIFQDVRHSLNY